MAIDLPTIRQRIVIEVQRQSLGAVERQASSLADSLGEVEDKADGASTEMDGLGKASKGVEKDLKRSGKAADDTGLKVETLGMKHRRAKADLEKFLKTNGEMAQHVEKSGKAAEKAGKDVDKLGRSAKSGSKDMKTLGKDSEKATGHLAQISKTVQSMDKRFKKFSDAAAGAFTLLGVKLPIVTGLIQLASQGLFSLGAGAIGLIGTLKNLVNVFALLPAIITPLIGAMGGLLLATRGVGQALGLALAPKAAKAGGAQDAVQRARKLADNVRDVAQAEEALSDAQRDQRRAQEALNKSWVEATEALRDLRQEQDRASISVERAEISLARARENADKVNADASATELDRRDALLDVKDAELDLKDAQEDRVKLARDLHEAEEKGVAGSDAVTDAQERASDAVTATADATLALSRAIEDMNAKVGGADTSVDQLKEAMKNLSPAAKQFVQSFIDAKPEIEGMQHTIQDAFFTPLTQAFKNLLSAGPSLTSFFAASVRGLGGMALKASELVKTPLFGKDLRALGRGNERIFDRLGDSLKILMQIFVDLARVGQPFVEQILGDANGNLQTFSDKIANLRADGGLADYFQRGIDATKLWRQILRDTFGGLANLFRNANGLTDHFLQSMSEGAKRFREITNPETASGNKIKKFFDDAKAPLHEFWLLLKDVWNLLFNNAAENQNSLAGIIARIRTEWLPVIKELFDATGADLMNQLLDLVKAFSGLFTSFSEAGISTLKITLELLTGVANALKFLSQHVPGFSKFVTALLLLTTVRSKLAGFAAIFDTLKGASKLSGLTGTVTKFFDAFKGATGKNAAGISASFDFLTRGAGGVASAFDDAASKGSGFFGSLAAGLSAIGPQLAIMAAIAAGAALIAIAYKKWNDRKKEIAAVNKDFAEGLKDESKSVADVTTDVLTATGERKNQNDDLSRAGITWGELGDSIAGVGRPLSEIRQQLLDTNEIVFKGTNSFTNNAEAVARAKEEYVRTGKVMDGFKTSNGGLVQTMNDARDALDKQSQKTIEARQATGDWTDGQVVAAEKAVAWKKALGEIDDEVPTHAAALQVLIDQQKDHNDEIQRNIDLVKERQALAELAILGPIGERAAKKETNTAEDRFKNAQVAAFLVSKNPKATEEERTAATDELVDAKDALLEASVREARQVYDTAYANSKGTTEQEKIADATSAYSGKVLELTQRLGDLGDTDLTDQLKGLRAQFEKSLEDIPVTFSFPQGRFVMTVTPEPVSEQKVANDKTAALPAGQGAAGFKAADEAATRYAKENGSPDVKAALNKNEPSPGAAPSVLEVPMNSYLNPKPISGAKDRSKRPKNSVSTGVPALWDPQKKQWFYPYAQGGMGAWGGKGFATSGAKTMVGEGNPAYPEFVIPTDPAYRGNAFDLLGDLMKRLGGYKMARGGTWPGGEYQSVVPSMAQMGHLDQMIRQPATQVIGGRGGDTTTIDTQVGNQYVIGQVVAHDYADFLRQLRKRQRMANSTKVNSGRTPR